MPNYSIETISMRTLFQTIPIYKFAFMWQPRNSIFVLHLYSTCMRERQREGSRDIISCMFVIFLFLLFIHLCHDPQVMAHRIASHLQWRLASVPRSLRGSPRAGPTWAQKTVGASKAAELQPVAPTLISINCSSSSYRLSGILYT